MNQELLEQIGGRLLSKVMTDEVPGFLFDNCFRDRSITTIVAPSHSGKSMLMLDMAICLEMEIPLFGRFKPMRNRNVFFVGADAPSWDYGLQSRKLCIGHGIDADHRALMDLPGIWHSGTYITDTIFLKWLAQWKNDTGADVLFIDSLRATHRADENLSGEMGEVWNILKSMRDSGWCIIMSHHMGHTRQMVGQDIHAGRGSTINADATDFQYNLSKRSRRDPRVRITNAKARGGGPEVEPFDYFDMVTVPGGGEMVNGLPLNGIKLVSGILEV